MATTVRAWEKMRVLGTAGALGLAAALALGALAGCSALREAADRAVEGKAACALDGADPSRFTCDGRRYAILADTVSDGARGERMGSLHAIVALDEDGAAVGSVDALAGLDDLASLAEKAPEAVATASFMNVFASRLDANALIVEVDGENHPALPCESLPTGAKTLDLSHRGADAEPGAFSVDPQNAARLIAGDAVYEVGDEPLDEQQLGRFLDPLAQSVTFDADTLRPLSRDELGALDWNGERANERRETRTYLGVWTIDGTPANQAVAVQVDDEYRRAVRV